MHVHYINLNISILMRSNSDWFLSFFFLIHFSQTVEHRRIKGRLIFNFISSTLSTNKDGPYTSNKRDLSEAYRSQIVPFLFLYIPLHDRNLSKKKKKSEITREINFPNLDPLYV